jgi:hypothetical protein
MWHSGEAKDAAIESRQAAAGAGGSSDGNAVFIMPVATRLLHTGLKTQLST